MSDLRCRSFRRAVVLLGGFLCLTASLAAQSGRARAPEPVAVHHYTLRNQPAVDALQWVLPLLSERGSVELRPAGNAIVVRELKSQMDAVLEALRRFDHEKKEVVVNLWLISAQRGVPISPPGVIDPALRDVPDVLERLRDYLQYSSYAVLGSGQARGEEGDEVTFEFNADYDVKFRLGTVLGLRRVPLDAFEVLTRKTQLATGYRSLMRSHLNLWLDRPMVLALSSGETSALLVVIRCELSGLAKAGT